MNDIKEVSDTLKAADLYLKRLNNLNDEIQNAEQQIYTTSTETEKNITTTFNSLLENLTLALKTRRDSLIKKVHQTKLQGLGPLEACRADIQNKIEKTSKLVNECQCYLLNGRINDIDEFSRQSSLLGSLPVIPELQEVPYLTFQLQPSQETDLMEMCSRFGEVSQIAPVQISQLSEKPGAILVEWQGVDSDDRLTDIQEFRLQRAFGNAVEQPHLVANFSDCYKGLDTQCLIKDLLANQLYSFRVCCKFEGSSTWSPWSIPQISKTTIVPFCWDKNDDYVLANENKIATPIKNSPSILFSDGPQFKVGYSVEFTYLEYDQQCSTIGLILLNDSQDIQEITDLKSGAHCYFAFDSSGEIYVDGVKKSTKLPEVTKGLKVSFTCELSHNDKVRVNIDASDKRVTYDWHICKDIKLYFAAQLNSPGSKIMVE